MIKKIIVIFVFAFALVLFPSHSMDETERLIPKTIFLANKEFQLTYTAKNKSALGEVLGHFEQRIDKGDNTELKNLINKSFYINKYIHLKFIDPDQVEFGGGTHWNMQTKVISVNLKEFLDIYNPNSQVYDLIKDSFLDYILNKFIFELGNSCNEKLYGTEPKFFFNAQSYAMATEAAESNTYNIITPSFKKAIALGWTEFVFKTDNFEERINSMLNAKDTTIESDKEHYLIYYNSYNDHKWGNRALFLLEKMKTLLRYSTNLKTYICPKRKVI